MAVYTVFGQAGGDVLTTDGTAYTMGMQFALSQSATLTGIWFYSPAGTHADAVPPGCAVYQVSGVSIVAGSQNSSPSWSAAGGSGWIRCAYPSGPVLSAGVGYKVVVQIPSGTDSYSATAHYWDSGAGASGLTSGIITAPNNTGGDGGQDTFTTGAAITYPATSFNANNYWVDVEVTSIPPPPVVYSMRTMP